ncbi:hypothetical protein BGZ79_009338 [Entomortierella chlamydospora]|nr:hypothetical protein BGZ79_009338 [Entomortierella chlamydospora]
MDSIQIDKELKAFFNETKDIEKADHFKFFDRVTSLQKGSAESTWLAGPKALAHSKQPKLAKAAEILQKKYDKSKKDGLLKSYWKKRKAEEELVDEAMMPLMKLPNENDLQTYLDNLSHSKDNSTTVNFKSLDLDKIRTNDDITSTSSATKAPLVDILTDGGEDSNEENNPSLLNMWTYLDKNPPGFDTTLLFLIETDFGSKVQFVNAIYMHLVRLDELNPWSFGSNLGSYSDLCSLAMPDGKLELPLVERESYFVAYTRLRARYACKASVTLSHRPPSSPQRFEDEGITSNESLQKKTDDTLQEKTDVPKTPRPTQRYECDDVDLRVTKNNTSIDDHQAYLLLPCVELKVSHADAEIDGAEFSLTPSSTCLSRGCNDDKTRDEVSIMSTSNDRDGQMIVKDDPKPTRVVKDRSICSEKPKAASRSSGKPEQVEGVCVDISPCKAVAKEPPLPSASTMTRLIAPALVQQLVHEILLIKPGKVATGKERYDFDCSPRTAGTRHGALGESSATVKNKKSIRRADQCQMGDRRRGQMSDRRHESLLKTPSQRKEEIEVEAEVEAEVSLTSEDQAEEEPEAAPETLDAALLEEVGWFVAAFQDGPKVTRLSFLGSAVLVPAHS